MIQPNELRIKIGDIVLHALSKLHFRCENKKHERWMSDNPYYVKTDLKEEPKNFANASK